MRRLHRDERGQSLAIVLSLVTVLFLMGTALAAHISVALKATVANEEQAGDLHAADAGAELGIWWQRNGSAGNPPDVTVNGLNVVTTVTSTTTPCPAPSIVRLTGFEHGAISVAGDGVFADFNGTLGPTDISADMTTVKTGDYSLRIRDTNSEANSAELGLPSAIGTGVVRVYLRLPTLPGSDVEELMFLEATAGNDLRLGYDFSSRNLVLRVGNGTPAGSTAISTTVVAANTWYQIEMRFVTNTNPRTASWHIDGVPQQDVTRIGTASTVRSLWFGSTVTNDAFTAYYDDVLISRASGDYPLGAGTVVGLRPIAMGASVGALSFREGDGSAIDPVTSFQRLDDNPMTSTGTDYVAQTATVDTDYIEVRFADTTATCIVGVSGLVAYRSATNGRNDGGTYVVDGTTAREVYDDDMSSTTLTYQAAIVDPATAPWTPGKVNALTGRIGYSEDANPDPYWDALMLEVASGVVIPGTVTVTSTAGNSTVTVEYVDVAMLVLDSWSTNR